MTVEPVLSRRRLILAALLTAGLETAVLGQMIVANGDILESGQLVRLKTVPVDPRDLLRGDYVTLGYEFSSLDSALVKGTWPSETGSQVMTVRLSPGGDGFWHPVEASFDMLQPAEGTVLIKSQPFTFEPQASRPASIRATYGLERYYVAEGQGKAIEEARNNHQVSVDVRVSADGSARIANLDVADGTP